MLKKSILAILVCFLMFSLVACGDEAEHMHTSSDWIEDTKATCKTEGTKHKECTECKAVLETGTIEKLTTHTPAEAVKENFVDSNCETEGSYNLVVYCTVCEKKISSEAKVVDKKEHTPSDWIEDSAATCKVEGAKHKECTECKAVLETGTIEKLTTHTPAEAVKENFVDSDCETEGSYNSVVYCSVCEVKLSSEAKVVEKKEHTPSGWITDSEATCKTEGTKHKECTECEEVLETGTIEKLTTHTPAEAVKENFVDSDCETEGSYNSVVYCSVCEVKLSSEAKVVEKKEHTPVADAAVPATCKDTGLTEGSHCSVCNKILVEQTIAPVLEHDMTSATCISPATCRRNCGYTEGTVSKHVIANGICTICEAKTISTVEELKNIALNGKYILVNDLSLDNVEWTPIGTNTKPFTGFFDGNGHTISNLKITAQHNYFGLFGYNTGSIQNLGITTISFSGYVRLTGAIYAGGLVGYNSGTIKNCYTSEVNIILTHYPDVSIASGYAGGLSGYNTGEILCCYSSGTQVSMSAWATISATYAYAGGLVGCNKTGTISDCYSTIKKVEGSYSGSNMNCASYVGGLVGSNNSGTLTNCYRGSSQKFYSTIISTGTYKPTNDEGTSVEATELNTIAFHTDILGWSTDNWIFNEGSLPSLKKEA